jgi:hypothetical protein
MKPGGRLDSLFTLLFMLLAAGAVVCYFVLGGQNPTYLILGGIAIFLYIVRYVMRFF